MAVDYDNPWLFKGLELDSDAIKSYYGFVYKITNLSTGRMYIGRKYFWTFRKPRKKNRRVKAESNWKDYYGSNEDLLADVKELGKDNFKREVLHLHKMKGGVNYFEVYEQWLHRVLLTDCYYNDNISGKFYSGRVKGYHEDEAARETFHQEKS